MDGFTDGWALWLLGAAALMALMYLRAMWRTSGDRAAFADSYLHRRLGLGSDDMRRAARNALYVLAAVAAVMSIARPTGSVAEEERRAGGMDVVVALDLSLSMAAREDYGQRLGRAKDTIRKLVARTPDNRYGLVTFTGDATVICPLTHDHDTFLTMLDTEIVSLGPMQGTAMGDGITAALVRYKKEKDIPRAILVVSDGENTYGPDPVETATAAREAGVKVYTLGVGSAGGARIPISKDVFGTITYKYDKHGRMVTSRLDEDELKAVAEAGGGKYFHASSGGAAESLKHALNEKSKASVETGMKKRREFGPALSLAAAGLMILALMI